MNIKKIIALSLALAMISAAFAGCTSKKNESSSDKEISSNQTSQSGVEPSSEESPEKTEPAPMKIAVMKGPTGMGMVQLMTNSEENKSQGEYEFIMESTADAIVGKLAKGEIDAAAVPANVASAIYNKTEGAIQVSAINTLGVLYVVESGKTIHSIEDLRGKTIYSTGKGTTPEFALNYVLKSNNIDPETDLTIEYKSEASEVAAIMANDERAIALLPQPFVTVAQSKNEKLRTALSLSEEWDKLDTDSSLVTGVLAVRKDYVENNSQQFDLFMEEYKKSVEFINGDTEEGAKLVAKYEIAPEAVAKKAIPLCNIVFITGEEMEIKLKGYLETLYEQNPQAVGGTLPDEKFYFKK